MPKNKRRNPTMSPARMAIKYCRKCKRHYAKVGGFGHKCPKGEQNE